jgi:SAM-dependent methyltransferase
MDVCHLQSADGIRSRIERGLHDPTTFRDALLGVPSTERDAWVDRVFGLVELPEDGPTLPRDGVPYLPCGVDALLRMVERVRMAPSDVFVDLGSGVGRAAVLVHLLTGAEAIGIEVQPALVASARELVARLAVRRVSTVEGDAAELTRFAPIGSVFFLYCPFGGHRLVRALAGLEALAQTRTIWVCCVDLPLPPCGWLKPELPLAGDLAIYRSTARPAPGTHG